MEVPEEVTTDSSFETNRLIADAYSVSLKGVRIHFDAALKTLNSGVDAALEYLETIQSPESTAYSEDTVRKIFTLIKVQMERSVLPFGCGKKIPTDSVRRFCQKMENLVNFSKVVLDNFNVNRELVVLITYAVTIGLFCPTGKMQKSSLRLFVTIYHRNPSHRESILERTFDMLQNIIKDPLPTYKIRPHQHVQVMSVIMMYLVDDGVQDVDFQAPVKAIKAEHRLMRRLIDKFLELFWTSHRVGGNLRACLDDIIKFSVLPKWPAAFIILKYFKASIAKTLRKDGLSRVMLLKGIEFYTTILTHCQKENRWLRNSGKEIARAIHNLSATGDTKKKTQEERVALAKAYILEYFKHSNLVCGWKLEYLIENVKNKGGKTVKMRDTFDKADVLLLSRCWVANSLSAIDLNPIFVRRKCGILQVRVLVIKSLERILDEDPRLEDCELVQTSLYSKDKKVSVNEASMVLLGKILLRNPALAAKYEDLVMGKLDDPSISIRKRAIKLFTSIDTFPNQLQAYAKILSKIDTDEITVQTLVVEMFTDSWSRKTGDECVAQVIKIISIVGKHKLFEILLRNILLPAESHLGLKRAAKRQPLVALEISRRMVNSLMNKLRLIKNFNKPLSDEKELRILLSMIYYYTEIAPYLFKEKAHILIASLETAKIHFIVHYLTESLRLVLPIIKTQIGLITYLEGQLYKIINDADLVESSFALLANVVQITKNYKAVENCFSQYYPLLLIVESQFSTEAPYTYRRSVSVVGYLLRFFKAERLNNVPKNIKHHSYMILLSLLDYNNVEVKTTALQALQNMCLRYLDLMLDNRMKDLYFRILTNDTENDLKVTVLKNIHSCFVEEDKRITNAPKPSDMNINQLDDTSSNLSSAVMQLYQKYILRCCINSNYKIRQAAYNILKLSLRGHTLPQQVFSHLICMTSDPSHVISEDAIQQLTKFNSKYPKMIETYCLSGLLLSYKLHEATHDDITRGYQGKEAVNSHLYSLSSKPNKRILVRKLLEHFETEQNPSFLLFIADNLASFPYTTLDEPGFLIQVLDSKISVTGLEALEEFEDKILQIDNDQLLERIPDDLTCLAPALLKIFCGTLMINLRDYLKDLYDVEYYDNDAPNATRRRNNKHFAPAEAIRALRTPQPSKQTVVARYNTFKQAMIAYDLGEEEALNSKMEHIPQPSTSKKQSKKRRRNP